MGTKYVGAVDFDSAVTMATTLVVTGVLTATGGVAGPTQATTLTSSGLTRITNPSFQQTINDVNATNATPAIADILGGIIRHTSVTGAGTCTVPTGTLMSGGISGVAVGSTVNWTYYNDGDQTVTITAAVDHTLVGTVAVTTGKYVKITSVCTATHVWVSFISTLM